MGTLQAILKEIITKTVKSKYESMAPKIKSS